MHEILSDKATQSGQQLNWQTSIVDLLKLLGSEGGLTARKQLASELQYSGDTNDYATMNVWLIKQVMSQLAANGGRVPTNFMHRFARAWSGRLLQMHPSASPPFWEATLTYTRTRERLATASCCQDQTSPASNFSGAFNEGISSHWRRGRGLRTAADFRERQGLRRRRRRRRRRWHHGVAGAAVGCAVGHHSATKKEKEKEKAAANASTQSTTTNNSNTTNAPADQPTKP